MIFFPSSCDSVSRFFSFAFLLYHAHQHYLMRDIHFPWMLESSASALWSFLPFNFILLLSFVPTRMRSSSSVILGTWTSIGACRCLKVSRRMTNCKYSSFWKAIYKTQKSFNKHYFLCRFSPSLGAAPAPAHHRNEGIVVCIFNK